MDARQLLVDTHPHLPPAATLDGLSPNDATRHVAGLPHSIAEIVAHVAYLQESRYSRDGDRCHNRTTPQSSMRL